MQTPVVTERVVEEKPKSRDYYRHRDVYSDSPYYSRSCTLPHKYYWAVCTSLQDEDDRKMSR